MPAAGYLAAAIGVIYGLLHFSVGLIQLKARQIELWSSIILMAGGVLTALAVISSGAGLYVASGWFDPDSPFYSGQRAEDVRKSQCEVAAYQVGCINRLTHSLSV